MYERWQREKSHFDREAEDETVFLGNEEFDLLNHPCIPENNFLLTLLGKEDLSDLRILDIGCGVGEAALCFAERGASVSAVDVSSAAIEKARHYARVRAVDIDFRVVEGYELPFADESFDLVYGNGVLHHLPLDQSAEEIRRVMKPRGKGFFIEPTTGNPFIAIYRKVAHRKRTADEKPLGSKELDLLGNVFGRVQVFPFQVSTLAVFFKMLLWERLNPNTTSYWRQPIVAPERYRSIYERGTKLDDVLRKRLPRFFQVLCWNDALLLEKAADV